MSKKPQSISQTKRVGLILRWALAAVLILFSIFPVLWIVSAALNPVNDLGNQQLIPANANFDNFRELSTNPIFPFFTWLGNSLKISVLSTLLTLSLTTMAAFAFSRFRFKGRQTLLKSILLIQSFPNLLAIVALFTIIKQIGDVIPSFGLNTHLGLILVYSGGAMGMNIWLMKGYMDTIPRDIDESAHVDGATDWQVFSRLLLPLLRPITAFVLITGSIFALESFGPVYVLTGGGPAGATTTLVLYLYERAFAFSELGYAAALGWALFVLLIPLIWLQFRLWGRAEVAA